MQGGENLCSLESGNKEKTRRKNEERRRKG